MVGFAISLIIQYHYIWWSIPFQIVNSKVNNTYIIVEFWPTPEKVKVTSPSCNPAGHVHPFHPTPYYGIRFFKTPCLNPNESQQGATGVRLTPVIQVPLVGIYSGP